ncbi:hypothetical protein [Virgibacillus pantothenticus]|nr:hypothetical protein [Virgibacillus pantothenticus]
MDEEQRRKRPFSNVAKNESTKEKGIMPLKQGYADVGRHTRF